MSTKSSIKAPMIAYTITTERLIVRCWEESDAGALKEAIDSSLEHLRRWMPWAHHEPEPIETKRDRIIRKREDFFHGREFTFGVFTQDDPRLVGTCSINFRVGPEVANFGYWLREDEQGKGYISEAVGGLTLSSFFVLKLPVAEIYCNLLNTRSAAVPRRLGFRKLDGEHVRQTADQKDRPSQVWQLNARELAHSPMATHRVAIQNRAGETLWKK